jgi:hyperosmotically inducible periplasmic protein
MKIFLALLVGIIVGAAAVWFYSTTQGKSVVRATGDQLESTSKAARDAIQEKLRVLDLRPDQVKDDLARTGQVVRRKARQAGQAIADATADARITGAIKTKLLANKDLSALSISVNTTGGIVTLSGTVSSPEDISKAMLLAMDTDGVSEVVSTLQVKAASNKR